MCTHLLLLGHDDAPRVAGAAVHDVPNPGLDLGSDSTAVAGLAHWDLDIAAAVVDQGHRADEVLQGS